MTTTTMKLLPGFKSSPAPENTRAIPGGVFHFLTMGEATDGRHALMKINVYRGAEPPEHTHSREDESYFILKGSIKYTIGENTITANEGDYVYLPNGVSHKFEILTEKAEVLMWISPAGLEQWFWDNSIPALDGKPLPAPQGPPPAHVLEHFVNSLREYGVEMK
jgi:quercetin dioxygenase-like cupin family protein